MIVLPSDNRGRHRTGLEASNAEEIDAAGKIVVPGFVDSHIHLAQTQVRGIGGDWSLMGEHFDDMLGNITGLYRPEDMYLGGLFGAFEKLYTGTTTALDWSDPNTLEHGERPSLLGRSLYGGVLAYMALDGFKNNDKRVAVAEEKGVPMPDLLVPFVTGRLLVANLGIVLWRLPRGAASALVVFFLGTTPAIYEFWTMEGKERQGNKINFLKNLALLGGAIVFVDAASGSDGDSDAAGERDEE